jgi:hypothetical protein
MSRIHGWDSDSGVAAVVQVVASGGLMSVVVTVPGVEVRVGGWRGFIDAGPWGEGTGGGSAGWWWHRLDRGWCR